MARIVTKHFSWNWDEVDSSERAAFTEEWTYSDSGALLLRRRVAAAGRPATPTISTDPRAARIMRERMGGRDERRMAGPHW